MVQNHHVFTDSEIKNIALSKNCEAVKITFNFVKVKCIKNHGKTFKRSNFLNLQKYKIYTCDVCRKNSLIIEAYNIADKHNGKCLSNLCNRIKDYLMWQCIDGHIWRARFIEVKAGSWCPSCSTGLYERICREYFEQIFNNHFPSSKPNWLVSDKNTRLQLDGYCAELGIAFEHNGFQHYKKTQFKYGRNFKLIKRYDKIKIDLCKANGVKLIIIPELFSMIDISDFE